MQKLIVLDTEASGMRVGDGNRIIELAALEVKDRKLTGEQFHGYFFPDCEIEAGAYEVHGISLEDLKDKPAFADRVDEFLDFVRGSKLIIHNAKFDVAFLNHELSFLDHSRYSTDIDDYCEVECTLKMAREKFPNGRNSLDALCKRFAIDNSSRSLHGALSDCHLLAQVYLRLTGGQKSLGLSAQQSGAEKNEASVDLSQFELPVIEASEEDRARHSAYMQKIREENSVRQGA